MKIALIKRDKEKESLKVRFLIKKSINVWLNLKQNDNINLEWKGKKRKS